LTLATPGSTRISTSTIKDLVKVKKLDGGFESREVAPGDLDETVTLIEIKQGLKPGEQVAEKPLELLCEEEKSKREQGRLARPAAAKPAPRKPALPQ
jgi:hypothetical protein